MATGLLLPNFGAPWILRSAATTPACSKIGSQSPSPWLLHLGRPRPRMPFLSGVGAHLVIVSGLIQAARTRGNCLCVASRGDTTSCLTSTG